MREGRSVLALRQRLVVWFDWVWSLEVPDWVFGAVEAALSELMLPELDDDEDGRLDDDGLDSAAAPGRLEPLEADFDSWYCFSAARVFGPMMPSTGPGSKPASFSICCCWRTSSLPALAPLALCEDAPGFDVADCDEALGVDEAPGFDVADCDEALGVDADDWDDAAGAVLAGWLALVLSDEDGVDDWA